MGRWADDAPGRLRAAALDLFSERGYEATTVADVAARAGLSERTFFRHFPDKREVLFDGSRALEAEVTAAVGACGASSALGAALTGLAAGATALEGAVGLERARVRARLVTSTAELREREQMKRAELSDAVARSLAARGCPPGEAALAAGLAVVTFESAFAAWVGGDGTRGLAEELVRATGALAALVATATPAPPPEPGPAPPGPLGTMAP
ncbi:MAG TPA: helix-turn-helix domain-containing protein [Acidimicrobiales bacterium]|nr:MAG: hypothetical protein B7Z69_05360 [Actinobacteria bacterium 21-73-9]HQU26094.1 helix-turn-helix domain-containing protein [Acidimicrobiales bacterium]